MNIGWLWLTLSGCLWLEPLFGDEASDEDVADTADIPPPETDTDTDSDTDTDTDSDTDADLSLIHI